MRRRQSSGPSYAPRGTNRGGLMAANPSPRSNCSRPLQEQRPLSRSGGLTRAGRAFRIVIGISFLVKFYPLPPPLPPHPLQLFATSRTRSSVTCSSVACLPQVKYLMRCHGDLVNLRSPSPSSLRTLSIWRRTTVLPRVYLVAEMRNQSLPASFRSIRH